MTWPVLCSSEFLQLGEQNGGFVSIAGEHDFEGSFTRPLLDLDFEGRVRLKKCQTGREKFGEMIRSRREGEFKCDTKE